MISRHFRILLFGLISACAALPASGAKPPRGMSADDAILAAQAAFRAGDPVKLARHSAGLEEHLLTPWLEYWRLKLRLEDIGSGEVRAFLAREPGSYLAERLRTEWLKELGKRGDWQTFELERAPLTVEDAEIRCYGLAARLAKGDRSALDELGQFWLEPKSLAEGCVTVAEEAVRSGKFTAGDVWQRVRLLLEAGQLDAARGAIGWLPSGEAPDERQLALAATQPQKFLASLPQALDTRPRREMAMFAAARIARDEPRSVAERLEGRLGQLLPAPDLRHVWGRVAYEAARRLIPEAADWYARAGDAMLNDEQLAWKVRAALRAGVWPPVIQAIDRMSLAAHQDAAWSYWYARALGATGRPDGARAYLLRIAGKPNFYGMLATEELGEEFSVPEPFHQPGADEVARAHANPGLARALELYRLNLRSDATREWAFTVRNLDDAKLIAAAELARQAGIFDRTINTAIRTVSLHNYRLRYLAPFREVFREYAKVHDLDEAWLLGLTRQESRFIANAKSVAGAQGLMQLMPATARWVAGKAGLVDFRPARVIEPEINIALGSRYLRLVLNDLGHAVLASAAYNAGPGRARRWRDVKPLEGAIYAETIPFNETRDYVKSVMANTVYYAALLGGVHQSLKARLGTIPAKAAGDRFNEELP